MCLLPTTIDAQEINRSVDSLQSATLDLLLNGVVAQSIPWTGNLSTYATALVGFQEVEVSADVELGVLVSIPNGAADEVPDNNQLLITLSVSPAVEEALLDLEIKFDNNPLSNYWELTNGAVLYSGGNPKAKYPNQPIVKDYVTPNATVHHTLAMPSNGCYMFGMYDVIGDGICCGNGQGYFKLKDFSGNILSAGAAFGNAQEDPFGIQNITGTQDNASILKMGPLDNDFCDQYLLHPVVTVLNNGNNPVSSLDFTVLGNSGTYLTES